MTLGHTRDRILEHTRTSSPVVHPAAQEVITQPCLIKPIQSTNQTIRWTRLELLVDS